MQYTYSYTDASLGADSDIYIIDSGIFEAHNVFNGRAEMLWSYNNDMRDLDGHGTHVVSLIVLTILTDSTTLISSSPKGRNSSRRHTWGSLKRSSLRNQSPGRRRWRAEYQCRRWNRLRREPTRFPQSSRPRLRRLDNFHVSGFELPSPSNQHGRRRRHF